MQIEILIAVVILFVLVFLATIDMAFGQLSDVGLRRLTSEAEEETGSRSAVFLRQILKNRPRFRFTLSASIQILLIIFSVLVTLITSNFYTSWMWVTVSLFVGLLLSFIFRQLIPRLLTYKNPEQRLLLLLPAVRPLYTLMSFAADPFERFLRSDDDVEKTVTPISAEDKEAEDEDNADDFQALIEVGEAEGIIEEEEREMIETMVEFSDTRASEVMTPRTEIVALSINATVREARDLIIEQKYSRLPVYRDKIDEIEGMIYVRDLLVSWAENKETQSIKKLIRPIFFVPETKPIDELLEEMQKERAQMSIIIDEYGGVAGLITMEDIVEEIVGEIEDEDEEEEIIEIIEGEDGYFDVLGSTEIDKIEHAMDLEIEEEDDDFNTIAGLVTNEAGYVPKKGERFTFRGLEAVILKCDDKKILLIRLRKASPKSEDEEEDS
ncbi:MAG TPA: hemolysin family protein [Pyrinomonadaceae bacterium]|jgi:CBS domain containing-hemolysin-like protein|nr:hemolysin family protein [Pyrinomonadaceae bacterium]